MITRDLCRGLLRLESFAPELAERKQWSLLNCQGLQVGCWSQDSSRASLKVVRSIAACCWGGGGAVASKAKWLEESGNFHLAELQRRRLARRRSGGFSNGSKGWKYFQVICFFCRRQSRLQAKTDAGFVFGEMS